jgi:hypothetical protein
MTSSITNKQTADKQQVTVAKRLFDLFYSDAKAHVETRDFSHIDDKGKHQFKEHKTADTPLTVEHVKEHLAGTMRISAYPIQQNDTARWGAIDIDLYDFDGVEFCDRVTELAKVLPLHAGVSKSGGARVWLFCEEPISAATLRRTLQEVRKSLGLPDKVNGKDPVEIYPKQESISAKGKASAIELPYCGMTYEGSVETSARIGHGGSLLLTDFLAVVQKASITQIKSFTAQRPPGQGHAGAPRDVNVLINKMTNETRGLLKEQPHPDKSRACWAIITEMINRDFSDDEVLSVLRNYPYGPYRHYAEHNSNPEEDIRRI